MRPNLLRLARPARTTQSMVPRSRVLRSAVVAPSRCYTDGAAKREPSDGPASDGPATAATDPVESSPDAADKSEWQLKFEKKDKEAAKLKEAYQNAVADFRNLQKTTEQEMLKAKQYALQKFAKDLIESVDNFDLALKAFPTEKLETSSAEVKEFHNGVQMVQQVLEKTLAKYGISKINPLGLKFDPKEHEALFQIPHEEKEPGTIIHVDRTGFKLHDRVLRAPKVGVVQEKS